MDFSIKNFIIFCIILAAYLIPIVGWLCLPFIAWYGSYKRSQGNMVFAIFIAIFLFALYPLYYGILNFFGPKFERC